MPSRAVESCQRIIPGDVLCCCPKVQVPNNHILNPKPVLYLLLPKTQVPNYGVLGPSGLVGNESEAFLGNTE